MASQFKTVGIYGRVKSPGVIDSLKTITSYLKELNQPFVVETETGRALNNEDLRLLDDSKLSEECDLLIVVGGDGSLLHAAHAVIRGEIPVIGINRGRLGFLTDIHPTELDRIKAVLEGEFVLEKRFLLTARVEHEGKEIGHSMALNEVALVPSDRPHMSEFEIYVDDKFVCSQDSDGLIIATPTGSTAYALSGGGPILHPHLDAIVLVPMFPHSLSMRPIVIDGSKRIKVKITHENRKSPRLTCDSRDIIEAHPGSKIEITKSAEMLHLIHPLHYDYYETLRSKLHWGHKLPSKAD